MSSNPVKCDVQGIVASIRQVGERCVKGISTAMNEYGELIAETARMYAPRETQSLENAIRAERMTNGKNGRIWIKIWIDPTEPYINPKVPSSSDKIVGDYVWLMEKYLTPYGSGGYHIREGSRAKGSGVGGLFLQRAVRKYRKALIDRARTIARRAAERG